MSQINESLKAKIIGHLKKHKKVAFTAIVFGLSLEEARTISKSIGMILTTKRGSRAEQFVNNKKLIELIQHDLKYSEKSIAEIALSRGIPTDYIMLVNNALGIRSREDIKRIGKKSMKRQAEKRKGKRLPK